MVGCDKEFHEIKLQWLTAVGSKWQVVIPKGARDAVGLNPGDDVIVMSKWCEAVVIVKSDSLEIIQEHFNKMLNEIKKIKDK